MRFEDNITLTHTDRGTPMGDLFRHFWMPALLSEELPANDCPPVRVKLLGEELVAFRDTEGKIGLLDAFCPHRRAELYLGRNEGSGLRCAYHGWKFDVNGKCMDLPTEECGERLTERMCTKAYPTMEHGGIVWAYMGPEEQPADAPGFDFCLVKPEQRYVSKCLMKCNYLQALEGSIDYSHISFLHKDLKSESAKVDVFGLGELIKYSEEDGRPTIFVDRVEHGLQIAARRNADENSYYWRIARWLMPCFVIVPTAPENVCRANLFVPIDDENCWWYRIRWHAERALTEKEIDGYKNGAFDYAELIPGTYLPRGSRENDYLQNRLIQRSQSYTGIPSAQLQDLAVQESQGRIHDRSRERLVKTDIPIVQCRRLLLEAADECRNGKAPAIASRPDVYGGRAYAITRPREMALARIREELSG
jgi:phthalate 4,5-dioxygenase oxygenase subunit